MRLKWQPRFANLAERISRWSSPAIFRWFRPGNWRRFSNRRRIKALFWCQRLMGGVQMLRFDGPPDFSPYDLAMTASSRIWLLRVPAGSR